VTLLVSADLPPRSDAAPVASGPSRARATIPPREAALGAAPIGAGHAEREATSTLGWVASTYFAEGLPYSLVHQVSGQLFTALGASLSAVGLTSLYGLAWNVKFLWSPLVDRFGTSRKWLLACELSLAAAVALVAWPAGRGSVDGVARMLVVVAVIAATHDVAVDAYYMAALDPVTQAKHSGFRVAAYRAALLVGQGGLVALAGLTSFRVAFIGAAVLLLGLALGHRVLLPEVERDRSVHRGDALGFVDAVTSFLRKDRAGASLLFLLTFRAGDALMFAMNAPFLGQLGLGTAHRGIVQGLAGALASIFGALAGGRVIARRGLGKTLFPIAVAQSLAILVYVGLAVARPSAAFVVAGVLVEQLVAGIGTSAFTVFILRRAAGPHRAAHFALSTGLMSVATTAAGAVSGYLASAVGFAGFFALAFAASLPGVALARTVPTESDPGAA
jgi:PAT family beta-lactamase induction signal transducer AmpG